MPPNTSPEDALRNVHAVDASGRLYSGYDAVLRILEEYPGSRALVFLGQMPGIRQLGTLIYYFIAKYRSRLFKRIDRTSQ